MKASRQRGSTIQYWMAWLYCRPCLLGFGSSAISCLQHLRGAAQHRLPDLCAPVNPTPHSGAWMRPLASTCSRSSTIRSSWSTHTGSRRCSAFCSDRAAHLSSRSLHVYCM